MTNDVIGLKVTDGTIKVEDLIDWISARDFACAEYLACALREYIETKEDVTS